MFFVHTDTFFLVDLGIFFRSDRKKPLAGNKPVGKPLHCHEDVFLHGLGALGICFSLPETNPARKEETLKCIQVGIDEISKKIGPGLFGCFQK